MRKTKYLNIKMNNSSFNSEHKNVTKHVYLLSYNVVQILIVRD